MHLRRHQTVLCVALYAGWYSAVQLPVHAQLLCLDLAHGIHEDRHDAAREHGDKRSVIASV